MTDIGKYNADPERYRELVEGLYRDHPPIELPPEYAYFIEKDLLRFLIRLARYKFVARLLSRTDRVLEVGCGSGLGSIFLGQHCAEVLGLEVKTSEVEEARSINRRTNVVFEVSDIFDRSARPEWDVVVALDVIEHMEEPAGRRLINCLARHLKPTGMLVIGSPSLYSYPFQSPLSQASHVKCYDLEEFRSLLDTRFGRTLPFCMNDELVHTGYAKMAWYYFVLGLAPMAD